MMFKSIENFGFLSHLRKNILNKDLHFLKNFFNKYSSFYYSVIKNFIKLKLPKLMTDFSEIQIT